MSGGDDAARSRAHPRLIVLAPSHYCERARWALDRAGVAYREVRWAPGPHVLSAKRLATGSTQTPILDLGPGGVIQGSGPILDWTGLPGADPDLELWFERDVAPLVRRFFYAALLGDPASGVRRALFDGVPGGQALAGRLLWPRTRRRIMRLMDARADLIPVLLGRVEADLARFDGVLAERGARLVGMAFGRADITAASLLAPLARPKASPIHAIYAGVVYPPAVEAALIRWGERPSLMWVHRAYAEHRRPGGT